VFLELEKYLFKVIYSVCGVGVKVPSKNFPILEVPSESTAFAIRATNLSFTEGYSLKVLVRLVGPELFVYGG
jgi:hypothetical protein